MPVDPIVECPKTNPRPARRPSWALAGLLGWAAFAPLAAQAGPGSRFDVVVETRENAKISGASVTVWGPRVEDALPTFKKTLVTDATGRVTFTLPASGRYDLSVFKDGHRSFSSDVEFRASEHTFTFHAVFPAMTVYGVDVLVVGSDGVAVENATVDVSGPISDRPKHPFAHRTLTDAAGRARLNLGQEGDWQLSVVHPRRGSYQTILDLRDASTRTSLTARLEDAPNASAAESTTFVVSVRSARGRAPVAGAIVTLGKGAAARRTPTNAKGSARVLAQGTGPFEMRVDAEGFEPAEMTLALMEAMAPINFDVELQPRGARHEPDAEEGDPPLDIDDADIEEARRFPLGPPPPEGDDVPPSDPHVGPREPAPLPPPRPETPPSRTELQPPPPDPKPPTNAQPPPPRPDEPKPAVDFTGRWRTTGNKTLTLTQTAASVTGTWEHFDSKVTGTVQGNVLELTTTSAQGLECSATVTMDPGGNAFFGQALVTKSTTDQGRRFHFDAERVR